MQLNTQCEKTRHELLCQWLRDKGIRLYEVAELLDVSKSSISRALKGATIPCRRHAQLVALGIPKDLLPMPLDITPGPKKKTAPVLHDTAEIAANPR